MSYCRFSSPRCDLYCYEDISGGYTTHVAGRRQLFEFLNDGYWCVGAPRWTFPLWRLHHALVRKLPLYRIGLSVDGQSFNDPDLPAFLDRLLWLRMLGYRVPRYVIEIVREEMNDAL